MLTDKQVERIETGLISILDSFEYSCAYKVFRFGLVVLEFKEGYSVDHNFINVVQDVVNVSLFSVRFDSYTLVFRVQSDE